MVAVLVLQPEAFALADSTVLCWGRDWYGAVRAPAGLTGVSMVSAGGFHSAAIRGDGRFMCWGAGEPTDPSSYPHFGQSSPPLLSGSIIACGAAHTMALSNGAVVCWGDNSSGQCAVPPSVSNVGRIAAGGVHSVALRSCCGMAFAWGHNEYGQCDVPLYVAGATDVEAGYYHTVLRFADGRLKCFGAGQAGDEGFPHAGQSSVPIDLGPVSRASAGWHHTIAIRSDGSVRCWGSNSDGQCDVPADLGPVVQADGGAAHTVALLADGTVRAWGANGYGQASVPPAVGRALWVAAGWQHTVVAYDNCPALANPAQADCDGDGIGDACELADGAADANGNGIPDDCPCGSDLTGDGAVTGADLGALLLQWGPSAGSVPADLDEDGQVNGADLAMLLSAWGACAR